MKEKIIKATIDIIQTEKDLSGITIRKIAKKAGIGVGLINYHFQTKENLINVSVRYFINGIINQWNDVLSPVKRESPKELLIAMFNATADFMAAYPNITRISILNDLSNPTENDNTTNTLMGALPVLQLLNSINAVEKGIEIIGELQWRFLRNDIYKKYTGFDFFDSDQRKRYLLSLIEKKLSEENSYEKGARK